MDRLITVIIPEMGKKEYKLFVNNNMNNLFDDDRIQWILAFDCPKEELPNIKKNNIHILSCGENDSKADIVCKALNVADGMYINFSNANIRFEKYYFRRLKKAINKCNKAEIIASDYAIDKRQRKKNPLNYRLQLKILELNDEAEIATLFPYAYFIRRDIVKKEYIYDICDEELEMFAVVSAIVNCKKIVLLPMTKLFYDRTIHRGTRFCNGINKKCFYYDVIEGFYIPLMEKISKTKKDIPRWLQYLVVFQLYIRYRNNLNAQDKQVLIDDEIDRFFDCTKVLLGYIDDEIIIKDTPQYNMSFPMRNLFEWIKYNGEETKLNRKLEIRGNQLFYSQCGVSYLPENIQSIYIRAINKTKEFIIIDAAFESSIIDDIDDISILVRVNEKSVSIGENDVYSLTKVFSRSINKKYTFSIRIPVDEMLSEGSNVAFYCKVVDSEYQFDLKFDRTAAKLNENFAHSYWNIHDDKFLICRDKQIEVRTLDCAERIGYEKKYLSEVKNLINEPSLYDEVERIRNEYHKRREDFVGRRIWIYFDKLYKGGDNGEYQFRYAMDNKSDDGIEHYYILNNDAPEWDRLNEEYPGHILAFGTIKCQLYGLMAENIVATHPDIIEFIGIPKIIKKYVQDLFNANIICIAHGITIQKNADYQNRLYDNTMYYTTSSKYEVKHLKHPAYDYSDTEIALTGMARFDGLKNNDKKQILITPTWRKSVVGTAERNAKRDYSELFKKSSYYKIYNSLINDQRIIKTGKKTGYNIIFLLHPAMSTQIDDYDRNDYVKLIQASGDMSYEKILTESSLMITDYSGIHYDFGYMRKPVIYYQPKEIPMRFEEGGMKFATMGFGPICDEYEDAVKLICEYMEKGCIMQEKYRRNADDFFEFNDNNNCERIYNAIYDWTEKRNESEKEIEAKYSQQI